MDKPVIENAPLLRDALEGLRREPKGLHPKWFYDSTGSELFERITELPEYYPTRTEVQILRDNLATLGGYVPDGAALIELGSGASTKTRILLDALDAIEVYVPVDISDDFLRAVAEDIDARYPDLTVAPLAGDLMEALPLPAVATGRAKVGFFPGSTIGNLEPAEARALLQRVRAWPDVAAFIMGVDLVKDPDILVRAYDDSAGVTAAFNRNVLHRLNREANADFDVQSFAHEARWNADKARIEMHLVSDSAQTVRVGHDTVSFAPGESIHTESSHKHSAASLGALAEATGWRVAEMLTDPDALFSVSVLVPVPD